MKKLILAMLLIATPALAQPEPLAPKAPLTDRERVQADRAQAATQEKDAPTARPWDRGADGKRPWESGPTGGSGATIRLRGMAAAESRSLGRPGLSRSCP